MKMALTNKLELKIAIFLIMSFVTAVKPASAQPMCDLKRFRLDKIQGKVVSNGPKGYEPIPQSKIELWRIGSADVDDLLIASTVSDENGLFKISPVKRGFYRLEVTNWELGFQRHYSVIKIAKGAGKEKQLLIRLGVGMLSWESCGDAALLKNK
jgi:hypothetical protein